jgi:hypothetical protein
LYDELELVFNLFPAYNMNMLLDFNAKMGTEDIFKPVIRKRHLLEIVVDNVLK